MEKIINFDFWWVRFLVCNLTRFHVTYILNFKWYMVSFHLTPQGRCLEIGNVCSAVQSEPGIDCLLYTQQFYLLHCLVLSTRNLRTISDYLCMNRFCVTIITRTVKVSVHWYYRSRFNMVYFEEQHLVGYWDNEDDCRKKSL